jgi:hypothetical protein
VVSYLARTLSSIADAGWRELTIFAEPATAIPGNAEGCRIIRNSRCLGPHRNFRAALAGLVDSQPGVDAYAVFEDDIALTAGLRAWLESGGLWPSGRVGVVSLYTAAINHQLQPGWHACPELPKLAQGALAYLFPPESARSFLSTSPLSYTWGQQDFWVGWWCRRVGLEYWMHSPSFIRHLGEVSSIGTQGLDPHRQCGEFLEEIDPQDVTPVHVTSQRHLSR